MGGAKTKIKVYSITVVWTRLNSILEGMKNEETPTVDVLLATFNGEKYLEEFLQSLKNQIGVHINLFVGDDGSRDKSLEIVKSYSVYFQELKIFKLDGVGPQSNFRFLLLNSTSPFVALADQDDIWKRDHLIKSVTRITKESFAGSKLSICATRSFGANSFNSSKFPYSFSKGLSYPIYFFENIARGCTMVMNAEARSFVNKSNFSKSIMHDWWIFLVLVHFGKVVFSDDEEVEYRIHEKNHIGNPSLVTKVKRSIKIVFESKWNVLDQLYGFTDEFKNRLEPQYLNRVKNLIEALRGDSSIYIAIIILTRSSYRTKRVDNLVFKGILILRLLRARSSAKKDSKKDRI